MGRREKTVRFLSQPLNELLFLLVVPINRDALDRSFRVSVVDRIADAGCVRARLTIFPHVVGSVANAFGSTDDVAHGIHTIG